MYHTNCDDAQTDQSLFWSYFPQMNISGKQNQSQKHCEARNVRMRRLTIRPVWPNSLCRFLMIQKLSVWMGATVHKSKGFLFEQSLIVRYVYIHPVHNIGKKLVILLRGRAGWSASLLLQRLSAHCIYSIILTCILVQCITLCFRLSRQVIRWAQSR